MTRYGVSNSYVLQGKTKTTILLHTFFISQTTLYLPAWFHWFSLFGYI